MDDTGKSRAGAIANLKERIKEYLQTNETYFEIILRTLEKVPEEDARKEAQKIMLAHYGHYGGRLGLTVTIIDALPYFPSSVRKEISRSFFDALTNDILILARVLVEGRVPSELFDESVCAIERVKAGIADMEKTLKRLSVTTESNLPDRKG